MKRSMIVSLFTLIFILAVSHSVLAQEPYVFCGGLSAEDCDIRIESQEVMQSLTSVKNQFVMSFLIANIPEAPLSEVSMGLASRSSISVDPDAQELLHELQHMQPEDMMGNMEELLVMLPELYGSIDVSQEMTIAISKDIAAILSAERDLDIPDTAVIKMRLVDGVLYTDLSDLADVAPEAAVLDTWYGINVVELLEIFSAEAMMVGLDSMDMNDLDMMSPGAGAMASMAMGQEALDEFVDVIRLKDEPGDDEDKAVFLASFDFAAFLVSPIFRDFVMMAVEMSGEDINMSEVELDQALMMAGMFAPMLLTDLDAGVIKTIGLDSLYLYRDEVYFEWDMATLFNEAQMLGDVAPELSELDEAPFLSMEMVNEFSGFNSDISITAPEEAFVIPTDIVLTALSQ